MPLKPTDEGCFKVRTGPLSKKPVGHVENHAGGNTSNVAVPRPFEPKFGSFSMKKYVLVKYLYHKTRTNNLLSSEPFFMMSATMGHH